MHPAFSLSEKRLNQNRCLVQEVVWSSTTGSGSNANSKNGQQIMGNDEMGDVDIESILTKLPEFIDNEGVDNEVWMAYNSILRAKTVFSVQCAFFASIQMSMLRESYIRRRQLQREQLSRSRKFNGQVKIWVMELKDIDLTHSLGPFFNGNLNLTVRVSLEGQMKGTTKSTPARAGRGFEPLKISQDVDFYVKRPTSIVHMEILHINEDQPDNSMTREVLIGQVLMNLQPLESQKTIRQWFPCLVNGAVSASIQLRMNYTFKEDVLQKWDPDSGLARSDEHGGANFTIGFIGVGQIGQCALDAVLKSCNLHPSRVHVSTRRPETLYNYSQIGVNVCFDNALVASTVDILFIAVQPNHLTQLVSGIRGKIRQETLVVSLIAGVGSERMCNLLQVPCVFRCSIGGEWGLPEPDPKEYQLSADEAEPVTDEEKRKVAKALERRKRDATIVENVQTALRALVPEPSDLRELIKLHSKVGTSMKLPNMSAMEVAQGAVCGAMVEQRICGQHLPMQELRHGAKVRITPTSADVADKIGNIKAKLPNREEYVVVLQDGTEVRSRRNRITEEGVHGPEEGFSIPEYRELESEEQWELFKELFTRIGEAALGGPMPTGEGVVSEKSSFYSAHGGKLGSSTRS